MSANKNILIMVLVNKILQFSVVWQIYTFEIVIYNIPRERERERERESVIKSITGLFSQIVKKELFCYFFILISKLTAFTFS